MAGVLGAEHSENNETVRGVPGKVSAVKNKWQVYEDGGVAQSMQEDEFQYRYGLNRYNRRTARGDVPVAKHVHTAEEERLQKERMLHLQQQREIAEKDAEIARQVHQEQVKKINTDRLGQFERESEDSVIAHQFQREEMLHGNAQELDDEKIARGMQDKERKKYERRQRERELARERKRLQQEQELAMRDAQVKKAGYRNPSSHSPNAGLNQGVQQMGLDDSPILREDGRVEDTGDFSDFYIPPSQQMGQAETKELQRLQDEELARLLQDQEHKRGARANGEKLKEIEENDARLAMIMQEQEKLKVARRKEHKHHRQTSAPEPHLPRLTGHPQRSVSVPNDHPHHGENMVNEQAMSNGRGHRRLESVEEEDRIRSQAPYSGQQQQHSTSRDEVFDSRTPPPNPIYQGRPLPDTPHSQGSPSPEPLSHHQQDQFVSRVMVGGGEPASPSPPGYTDPPSYRRHKNSAPQPGSDHGPTSGNMFTAIDPTYNRDRDMTDPIPVVMEAPPAVMSPHRIPPTEESDSPPMSRQGTATREESDSPPMSRQGTATRATAAVGGEDSYCDLDDMGPVQGQKRTTLKRDKKSGKKGGSCKQQ